MDSSDEKQLSAAVITHNKPEKTCAEIFPKDYVCTENDLNVIEQIKKTPQNGTVELVYIPNGVASVTREQMECLFQTSGENAYLNDEIFLPINIEKRHWYLGVINARKRNIQILDSSGTKFGRKDLKDVLKGLQRQRNRVAACKELKSDKWHDLMVAEWPRKEIDLRQSIQTDNQGLQVGFYDSNCPDAEDIVRSTVEQYYNRDATIAPALLRLHFHDCFVQGCDASVLISGPSSEMTAPQNTGLRGFEVIDNAKSQLEAMCPGVVSCADILALAARDAVDLTGGPGWSVQLGRRDGRVSSASGASALPSPADPVSVQKQKFAAQGLTDKDLVTLVGAHTIGQTECQFFSYRLFNFTATGSADPTISQAFLPQLRALCPPNGDPRRTVALDRDTPGAFDVSFFKNVRDGNAVLESDQRLWSDAATQAVVQKYAGNIRGLFGLRFGYEFPRAMVKMGAIGVKTGGQGEVRRRCSRIN